MTTDSKNLFENDTSLMAQPSVPAVIVDPPGSALVEAGRAEPPSIPPDMRAGLMMLPREQQAIVAAEYVDRRKAFRDWLRSQLIEGVHYGYPPKLAPKFDKDGNALVSAWNKKANEGKGGYETTTVAPNSWTMKPSLYKAGADFVCDLLVARDEYEADMLGWEQLGKPKETFVYACRLYSRANGDLIGEGRGVRSVGQKGGDANNAIKMAKKSAKVDAVLNAYGLSDLFTQDTDEPPQRGPENESPKQAPNAPQAHARGEAPIQRPTAAEMKKLCGVWKKFMGVEKFNESTGAFCAWVDKIVSEFPPRLDPDDFNSWAANLTIAQYQRLMEAMP